MFFILFILLSKPDAPIFLHQVMDYTQTETDAASFTCSVTGEPVPTISWYFNDVPVDVTNTVKYDVVFSGPGQITLRINNVQSSDVGTYTCNATNVVSSDTSSGVLTVNGEYALLLQYVPFKCNIVLRERKQLKNLQIKGRGTRFAHKYSTRFIMREILMSKTCATPFN